MTRRIEREIAALDFDARGFHKGIDTSLKDIDRLTKGLQFEGAAKSINQLDRSSRGLNFNPLASSIGQVTARLSTMGVIGATVVSRLTNSVIDGAKSIFNTLVTQPLKTGLEEYETQINAIQTILSNTRTKGTVLSDVTEALDELNKFADLTIFNFTEMTRNIGTFTAAGVDLETSVGAIKGIANLAAASGSSSQQASVAMYQLSQAISSGTVRLMDWNSVTNAGLGGELFKDLLISFGEVTGKIEEGTITSSNFRESLQEGWLTSDVLLASLQALAGELDHLDLVRMGFTDQEASSILAMAADAEAAATQIKTATQLVDVAIEAMQSGWAQTWRLLIGDFHQAKDLFGDIGSIMTGAIEQAAAARNRFFEVFVVRGGRELAIGILKDGLQTLLNTIALFKSAAGDVFAPFKGFQLFEVVRGIAEFIEKLKMASETGERFKSIIRGLASIFDIVKMLVLAILEPLFGLRQGALETADGLITLVASFGDWLFALRNTIKDADVFGKAVDRVLLFIRQGIGVVREWVQQFVELEVIQDIIRLIQNLERSDFIPLFQLFRSVLVGIGTVIGGLVLGVKSLIDAFTSLTPVRKILDGIREAFTYDNIKTFISNLGDQIPYVVQQFDKLKGVLGSIGDNISAFARRFTESAAFTEFVDYINSMDGSRFTSFLDDFRTKLGWVPDLLESIKDGLGSVRDYVKSILPDVGEFIQSIGDEIGKAFAYLNNADGSVNFTGLANVINAGLLGAILLGIRKVFTGGWITDILDKYIGGDSPLVSSITGAFGALEDAMTAWQTNLKADTITKIAIAIGIVAASALALSLIDQNKLTGAVIAMGALMTELFGGAAIISKLSFSGIASASVSVLLLASALLVLSIAVAAFSRMDPQAMQQGLIAIGIALGGFVVAIKGLSIGPLAPGMIKAAVAFGVLAGSMILLAVGIEKMGAIPMDAATDGLIRMGVALAAFVAFSKIAAGHEVLLAALAIGGLGASIVVLARGIAEMGSISWDAMLRGLVGLAASLGILAIAVRLMTGSIAGAAAIIVLSGAVYILAKAMEVIGALSWEAILKSLVALAGVFLIFGLAGALLTPLVPVLLGLGAAMLLMGLGALAFGAGASLAAAGLVLLAGSAAAIAGAILVVGAAVALILPQIAEAIAKAITSFLQTLADSAPQLLESGKTLILTFLQAITDVTPEIVLGLVDMLLELLQAIAEKLPEFVQAGFDILIGFLKGIEDNIQEVVATAVNIVTKFIEGLTESVPLLVDAGFEFVVTLVTAIGDALIEHGGDFIAMAKAAAGDIITGFVQGIWDGLQDVIDAAFALGEAAVQALKDSWQSKSPSRVAREIAHTVHEGFNLGIRDGEKSTVRQIVDLGQKAQNGMKRVMSDLGKTLDAEMNLAPVIRPVLDLADVQAGMGGIRGSGTYALGVSSSIGEARAIERRRAVDGESNAMAGDVHFTQNNYSPKTLNSAAIYRQTKSQIARLRDKELDSK